MEDTIEWMDTSVKKMLNLILPDIKYPENPG